MYFLLIIFWSVIVTDARRRHPTFYANKDLHYSWNETYANVTLDHFSYTNGQKFPLRFLYNLTYWKPGGPIFYYLGNEAPITTFASATGIMWDLAPLFNASIIFAEHRYYGQSYPWGINDTFRSIQNLGYLSSIQALGDFAELIPLVKNFMNCSQDTPVIVFGGSYGGMLAVWFRMKYPTITAGAWAASAPVLLFKNGGPSLGAYFNITSRTFLKSGCNETAIRAAFQAIDNYSTNSSGIAILNQIFKVNTSSPLITKEDVENFLKPYIREAFESLAELDYPYPANFLAPLPKWPVREACKYLTKDSGSDFDRATHLFNAISVYYGNKTACVRSDKCPDAGFWADLAWSWQECTEIIIEKCALGPPNDFFWSYCNESTVLSMIKENCQKNFNNTGYNTTMLREDGVEKLYGFDFRGASNIIFTNGDLDVWSSGGVTENSPGIKNANSRGIYNYYIHGSAHHLDLRQPTKCDPTSVVHARYQIVQILLCWAYPTRPECSTPFQQQDLPEFEEVNATDCTTIINGYPWGIESKESKTNSANLSAHGVFYLTIVIAFLSFFY